MLSNVLFIIGFVIVATQANSFDRVKIEDPTSILKNDIATDEDRIPTLQEILEIIKDFDFDLLDVDTEELNSLTATITELVTNSDPIQLRLCLMDIVRDLDREEAKKYLQVLIEHGPELLRLNIQRRKELAECELIGGENPSLIEQIQKRRCIAELEATIGTQITIVTIKLRPAVNYYRPIAQDGGKCIGMDVLPTWPIFFPQ